MLKPKDEFKDLVETVVIFITEHDVMQDGQVIYHIDRTVKETGKTFHDEAHIIYVNGQCQDDSPVGKLMHDFNCTDPAEMHYPEIAEKAHQLKYEEKEVCKMAGVMEQLIEEEREKMAGVMEQLIEQERVLEREKMAGVMKKNETDARKEFAAALLLEGTFSNEKIAKMSKLPLAEVDALAVQV